MPSISEFAHEIGQSILKAIYDAMLEPCDDLFTGMFASLNYQLTQNSTLIRQSPEAWNANAFNLIKALAEYAFTPLAMCFIAVLLAWELVHILQDSNQMGGAIHEKLILLVVKCGVCSYVCSHSFDLVMLFFQFGAKVSEKIGKLSGNEMKQFDTELKLVECLKPIPDTGYTVGLLFELAGVYILLVIGSIMVLIIGAIMYIRVSIWFMEFLIYASAASIPNATWLNKEWGQVGMNYTRKMLAVAFEGPFMLLIFSLYGGVVGGINTTDFKQTIIMIIGCGFAVVMMMFKAGNISASIFNAH